jgi:protein-tyrosine phosphatase
VAVTDRRGLGLVGAPNARQLGGLPAADGRQVRAGMLIRSGALGRLTDDDLPVLAKLDLSCVLDLRHDTEIAQAPNRLPEPAPRVRHLPIYDQSHQVFTYVAALLHGRDVSAYAELVEQGSSGAMAAIYRWFVSGPRAREAFAQACRELAEPRNLPAVFHCSVGKDRTGWLTAILLTALGVDRDDIRLDYLRTNDDTAGARETLMELLAERRPGVDLAAIEPLLQARTSYLEAAYTEVERVYGSFEGYLRAGLGLDDQTLASLRTHLLE